MSLASLDSCIVNLTEIAIIASEIEAAILGRRFSKILRLSRFEYALDFDLPNSLFLYLNIAPADPRTYLVRRRYRELEKTSLPPTPLVSLLNKSLAGAMVESVKQVENERVIRITFATGSGENREEFVLVFQLTGRSTNLFLVNSAGIITDCANFKKIDGQQPGSIYSVPVRAARGETPPSVSIPQGSATSFSGMLDRRYSELTERRDFENLAASARRQLDQKLTKMQALAAKLREDMASHGDPEKWKRIGDLLLANPAARREDNAFVVTDYYDPNLSEICIEAKASESIPETAQRYFKRGSKAKNALGAISGKLEKVESEIESLFSLRANLEAAISTGEITALSEFTRQPGAAEAAKSKSKQPDTLGYARKFVSADGFEILVGKKAKDNDYLTFREARSNDIWLHAADYPGSHVVIRNPNRREIPHQTLLEAASLAAFYSQGKKQPKAAVNYTQRKFVHKPRGAAAGLVRLASFKTILVEPNPPREREK